jgi:hypothetical protein
MREASLGFCIKITDHVHSPSHYFEWFKMAVLVDQELDFAVLLDST